MNTTKPAPPLLPSPWKMPTAVMTQTMNQITEGMIALKATKLRARASARWLQRAPHFWSTETAAHITFLCAFTARQEVLRIALAKGMRALMARQ